MTHYSHPRSRCSAGSVGSIAGAVFFIFLAVLVLVWVLRRRRRRLVGGGDDNTDGASNLSAAADVGLNAPSAGSKCSRIHVAGRCCSNMSCTWNRVNKRCVARPYALQGQRFRSRRDSETCPDSSSRSAAASGSGSSGRKRMPDQKPDNGSSSSSSSDDNAMVQACHKASDSSAKCCEDANCTWNQDNGCVARRGLRKGREYWRRSQSGETCRKQTDAEAVAARKCRTLDGDKQKCEASQDPKCAYDETRKWCGRQIIVNPSK
jgi:hypothetical protein